MACVDLPAFPLQLLLERHPEWRDRPAAVVDCDKPQGKILWVNERARSFRILPGMRYAAALSLAGDLRAAVVPRKEVERSVRSLVRRLHYFTPHVEPAIAASPVTPVTDEPGVFWLDASGLERLHDSLSQWAGLIRSELKRSGFRATVVVGFTRFGVYALARARRGVIVLKTPADERAAARRVPLDRLALDPGARDALHKLGIETVGRLVDLPPEGIERRFGPETYRLHRLAAGELRLPLQPRQPSAPVWQRLLLDHPETVVARLMLAIERLMHPLLEELADRGHAMTEVRVGFRFERTGDHIESIRPATPTLDAAQLLDLIRLRLEAVRKLPDGVAEVVLIARGAPATQKQLQLFGGPKRDLAAANRALARVRAELGDGAVIRARLREGHLPEGSFTWEPLDALESSRPGQIDDARLVRRIHARPIPLPQRPRQEPDGWMLRGLKQGPVVRVLGPYVVSGGWWNRAVHREYHFAETQRGELLWVFYDRGRRRWFLHGRVE
jgi:protein ImuB